MGIEQEFYISVIMEQPDAVEADWVIKAEREGNECTMFVSRIQDHFLGIEIFFNQNWIEAVGLSRETANAYVNQLNQYSEVWQFFAMDANQFVNKRGT